LSESIVEMNISIADNLKKRFHAACFLWGLKISQVVAEFIEQSLKANVASASGLVSGESMARDKVMKS
jgi:antitoxin component of RelBE/YafQ-DinJ toxin-antitoxin module